MAARAPAPARLIEIAADKRLILSRASAGSRRDGLKTAPGERLENLRQRGRGAPPRALGRVVVGVVQQQHRALAGGGGGARRDRGGRGPGPPGPAPGPPP